MEEAMKQCSKCGQPYEDVLPCCSKCEGYEAIAYVPAGNYISVTYRRKPEKRPRAT